MTPEEEAVRDYQEAWSKCAFCGKYNGKYGRPLQQHSSRCLYKGDANNKEFATPNYMKFIAEDDVTFLPMLWARNELPIAKRKIERLLVENGIFRAKLIELGIIKEDKEEDKPNP